MMERGITLKSITVVSTRIIKILPKTGIARFLDS
jgi:hypothetical protein